MSSKQPVEGSQRGFGRWHGRSARLQETVLSSEVANGGVAGGNLAGWPRCRPCEATLRGVMRSTVWEVHASSVGCSTRSR